MNCYQASPLLKEERMNRKQPNERLDDLLGRPPVIADKGFSDAVVTIIQHDRVQRFNAADRLVAAFVATWLLVLLVFGPPGSVIDAYVVALTDLVHDLVTVVGHRPDVSGVELDFAVVLVCGLSMWALVSFLVRD